jgi:hypothetical protein
MTPFERRQKFIEAARKRSKAETARLGRVARSRSATYLANSSERESQTLASLVFQRYIG